MKPTPERVRSLSRLPATVVAGVLAPHIDAAQERLLLLSGRDWSGDGPRDMGAGSVREPQPDWDRAVTIIAEHYYVRSGNARELELSPFLSEQEGGGDGYVYRKRDASPDPVSADPDLMAIVRFWTAPVRTGPAGFVSPFRLAGPTRKRGESLRVGRDVSRVEA